MCWSINLEDCEKMLHVLSAIHFSLLFHFNQGLTEVCVVDCLGLRFMATEVVQGIADTDLMIHFYLPYFSNFVQPILSSFIMQRFTYIYYLLFFQRGPGDTKALSTAWPKPKDEGWFLVLGHRESGELWALKRVAYVRGQLNASIAFAGPETEGKKLYSGIETKLSNCFYDMQFQRSVIIHNTQQCGLLNIWSVQCTQKPSQCTHK